MGRERYLTISGHRRLEGYRARKEIGNPEKYFSRRRHLHFKVEFVTKHACLHPKGGARRRKEGGRMTTRGGVGWGRKGFGVARTGAVGGGKGCKEEG